MAIRMDSQTWQRCVEDAKLLIMGRNLARAKVCELAIKACQITWGGGGHWSKFDNQATVSKFANEVGIHPKTLTNWLGTYRYVFLRLPEYMQNDSFNWTIGDRCRRGLSHSRNQVIPATSVLEAYNNLLNASPIEKMTNAVEQYIRNILHNYRKLDDEEDMEDFEYMVSEMLQKMIDIRLKRFN